MFRRLGKTLPFVVCLVGATAPVAPQRAEADCGPRPASLVATWPTDGASDVPAGFPVRVLLPAFWELTGLTVNGVDVDTAEFLTEPNTDYEIVIRGTSMDATDTEMGRITFSTGAAPAEVPALAAPELLEIQSAFLGIDARDKALTPRAASQLSLGCYDTFPIEFFQSVPADWSHFVWQQDALLFETEISGIIQFNQERTSVFTMLGCPAAPIFSRFFGLEGEPCLRMRIIAPIGDTSEWSEPVCTMIGTLDQSGEDTGPTSSDAGETNDAQAADTNSDAATDSSTDDTESESDCSTTRPLSGGTAALLALAGILVRRRRN